jgi:hypothetical protein
MSINFRAIVFSPGIAVPGIVASLVRGVKKTCFKAQLSRVRIRQQFDQGPRLRGRSSPRGHGSRIQDQEAIALWQRSRRRDALVLMISVDCVQPIGLAESDSGR